MEEHKSEVYLLKTAGQLIISDYKRDEGPGISQTLLETLGFPNLEIVSRKIKCFIIFSIKCNTLFIKQLEVY